MRTTMLQRMTSPTLLRPVMGAWCLCFLLAQAAARPAGAATLIDFDFSGVSGLVMHDKNTFELTAVNTLHPQATLVQGINVFPPASPTFTTSGGAATNDLNLTYNSSDTTLADAASGPHYFTFTLGTQSDSLLNLNGATFSVDLRRNGPNAAQNYYLLVSTDGTKFVPANAVATLPGVNDTVTHTITGSLPGSGFENVVGPIEVRLFANQSGGMSGGNTHFSAASITNGEVVSAEVAGVVLATSFAGRTVSGDTAGNITWSGHGVVMPGGSLTVVNESPGSLGTPGLFDTPDAQGHFAVNKNLQQQGPWSVTIEDLALDIPNGAQLELREVLLDWQHFKNSGNFQTENRQADWTVEIIGSVDGLIDSVSGNTGSATSGLLSLAFASPLNLYDDQTYDIRFHVSTTGASGNNTGLNGIMLLGSVVPEPQTYGLALCGVIAAGLLLRNRSKQTGV